MSAVIAVAGRYGVGKSVLVNQMVENGARLASFLENDQGICHQNQLEKIILREAGQGITVIEITSFLAIGTWAQLMLTRVHKISFWKHVSILQEVLLPSLDVVLSRALAVFTTRIS